VHSSLRFSEMEDIPGHTNIRWSLILISVLQAREMAGFLLLVTTTKYLSAKGEGGTVRLHLKSQESSNYCLGQSSHFPRAARL
jgi:hypothetical protein